MDRDLWPLGSWNKSLGEVPKGKGKSPLSERAIWHSGNNPEVLELTEADRQLVCRHPPATSTRAEYLATELLPRGCYFDPLDLPLRTAVGHWDLTTLFSAALWFVHPVELEPATAGCGTS